MSVEVTWIPRPRRNKIKENTERLIESTTEHEKVFKESVERVKSAATAVERASWQLVRDHDRVMRAAAWTPPRKG